MNKIKMLVSIIALSMFGMFAIQAGQETQIVTNIVTGAATNTIAIPGSIGGTFTNGETISGNTFITGGAKSTQLFLEAGGYFRNTSVNATNVNFVIAQSVTGNAWTNRAIVITVTVPASSTNYAFTQYSTTAPAPFYTLRAVEVLGSVVTGDAGTVYLKAVNKPGM